jgi:hypothetical protein
MQPDAASKSIFEDARYDTALAKANLLFARRQLQAALDCCIEARAYPLGKHSRKQWLDLEVTCHLERNQPEQGIQAARERVR